VWRPPSPPVVTAPARSAPTARLAIVALLLLVLGGAGYRFATKGDALPKGTSDYVAGHGVDYTAPDGSYSARFPVEPEVTQEPVTIGSVTATVNAAIATTGDYEIGVASIQLPVTVPPDRVDEVLDGALNGGLTSANGKLVSKQRIERGGLPANDAKFKAPDGYSARVLVMLAGSRLYVLFVHAKGGTDKLFRALDASFVPRVTP
jgi:hypothetical protein